jgi:glycosyltransferase involved in cell wall biosynthesis
MEQNKSWQIESHRELTKLFIRQKNRKGAAFRSDISAATGDIVIIEDTDLEYDLQEYLILLEPFIQGKMGGIFTNINLTDVETCYKAFGREIKQSIKFEENRFGFEFVSKIPNIGLRICEVGISYCGKT